MNATTLLHQLVTESALRAPDAGALRDGAAELSYEALAGQILGASVVCR